MQEMFACNTLKEARNKKSQIVQEYQDVAEIAMSCLDEGGKCHDRHATPTSNVTLLPYFKCC